jgi:small-conductance mechanosensitive channel
VLQTAPELIAHVPDMLRGIAARHEHVEFVRAGMIGIGQWSLDFETELRVTKADYDYFFATRSAILTELLQGLDAAGVRLAYPAQTSFTAAPDGSLILPYHP